MQRQTGTILDQNGRVVAGANITVLRAADLAAASLWSDDGITALGSNVVQTNARGFYSFYARNGVYSLRPTKTGYTFMDNDLEQVPLFDPADASNPWTQGGRGMLLSCDFMSLYKTGQVGVTGGAILLLPTPASQINLKAPTSTFRNGWLDCVSDGTASPNTPFLAFGANGTAQLLTTVPTAPEVLVLEWSWVSVGTMASNSRRFGLANQGLQTPTNPTDGIFLQQIAEAQLGLVTYAGGVTSSVGFSGGGISLTPTIPVRVRMYINSGLVWCGAQAGGSAVAAALTTNIPTGVALLLVGGCDNATAGVGFAVDYVRAFQTRA